MLRFFKYNLLATALLSVGCSSDEGSEGADDSQLSTTPYLELVPSVNFIVAGAQDQVTFTLYADQVALEDSADFVIYRVDGDTSTALSSPSYSIDMAKEYYFYATYLESQSAQITVKGVDSMPEAAADPSPEKFDSFRKHALGLLATGTDCPNCYKLIAPVHEFEQQDVNGDLIMTEVHEYPLDPMKCEASYWMDQRMGRLGFPTLRFNLSGKPEYYIATSNYASVDDVATIVEYIMSTPAQCAISATSVVEGDLLQIRADIKIAVEGEYKIGAMVVEDGIYAPQVSATGDWMNTHNAVLCGAYPLNYAMCEKISNTKYQAAESKHLFYCEFDLRDLTSLQVRENCRIVIYVYDNYSLVVDNVIQFPMGGSHDVTYTDI